VPAFANEVAADERSLVDMGEDREEKLLDLQGCA